MASLPIADAAVHAAAELGRVPARARHGVAAAELRSRDDVRRGDGAALGGLGVVFGGLRRVAEAAEDLPVAGLVGAAALERNAVIGVPDFARRDLARA